MLVHSLASKYARFAVIVRQMYWTPPLQAIGPPPFDLFFREPRDIGPPPLSKILDTPLIFENILLVINPNTPYDDGNAE